MSDVRAQSAAGRASGELGRERLLGAIRAREEFLEDILGSLEAFFTLDGDWRVTFANRSAQQLSGLAPGDIVGEGEQTRPTPGTGSEAMELLQYAMRERVPAEFDMRDPVGDRVFRGRAYPLDDGGLAVYLRDVTERNKAEVALAEAEQRLRLAVDAGHFGTFDVDLETGALRWDDAMKRLWGVAPDGQPTLEEAGALVHEDDRERVAQTIAAAYDPEGDGMFEVDFRIVWPDASVHWMRARGHVSFAAGPDGVRRAVRSTGLASDIDQERTARESEERLLALMDHNPSLVFLKDEEGRYVYLNRSYEERFAGSREWRGKTDLDLWPRASAELFRVNDLAVLAAGEAQQFVEDSTGPDGQRYVWLNYKFPFTDAEGRRYVGGIGIDITGRIRAEEALRESEDLLQTVLAHSRDGINMLDLRTGRYVFMNEAQVALTGFTAEELNGISTEEAYDRVHPEDRAISVAQQRRAAAGEDDEEAVEYRWMVRSGEYRWFSDRRRIVRDAHGTPVALVGISRDITELKRAEAARERQGQVAAGIASILGAALTAPSEERLGELCLQVAESLTESESGFIGEIGADGELRDLTLGDGERRPSAVEDQAGRGRPRAGLHLHQLCDRVLQSGEPLMTDDATRPPASTGLPEGHPVLTAFLGVPLKRGERVTGIVAVADRPGGYGEEQVRSLESITPVIAEAIERRRTEEALRANELFNAAQLERNRLARDLHDSVTQALFAATIKAEALTLDQKASPGVTATAEQVRRLTRGALAQMRTLLLELRTEPVHDVPLQQLLRHLCEATESRASTSVRLTVRGDAQVPPPVHVMLYRVAQEALNNVARHAHAANAWLVLDLEPSSARLVVGDDGAGFEIGEVPAGHLGLVSMSERAAEAGATLTVTSSPSGGTEVVVEWREAAAPARPA